MKICLIISVTVDFLGMFNRIQVAYSELELSKVAGKRVVEGKQFQTRVRLRSLGSNMIKAILRILIDYKTYVTVSSLTGLN